MASIGTGSFFGYRSLAAAGSRTGRLRKLLSPQPPKLGLRLVEHLALPGYDYRTFRGDAPEEWSSWQYLPWQCRLVKWMIRGGRLEIQLDYDGSNVGDSRVIRSSTMTLDSFIGFRVRQAFPGDGVSYQLIAIV